MNNKKKRSYGVNVGSSSIMLIFVILCLVSFSVLAISSAQADRSLSSRLAERTSLYYQARNQGEEYLAELKTTLKEAEAASSGKEEYFGLTGGNTKQYTIPLSGDQDLILNVTILYPPEDGAYFRVDSCNIKTFEEGIIIDDSLDVFMGEF